MLNHNRIGNLLPIAVIIFIFILVIGFVSKKEPAYKYKLTTEETLEKILERSETISPEDAAAILFSETNDYRFIDLRNPHDFLVGHIEGAINIPANTILSDEVNEVFNEDGITNILYSYNHLGACCPWMVLTQLGYTNNVVLLGGYDYMKTYVIDDFAPRSGNFRDEKALYDYKTIVEQTAGTVKIETDSDKEMKTVAPKVKRKKRVVEEEGGC